MTDIEFMLSEDLKHIIECGLIITFSTITIEKLR